MLPPQGYLDARDGALPTFRLQGRRELHEAGSMGRRGLSGRSLQGQGLWGGGICGEAGSMRRWGL